MRWAKPIINLMPIRQRSKGGQHLILSNLDPRELRSRRHLLPCARSLHLTPVAMLRRTQLHRGRDDPSYDATVVGQSTETRNGDRHVGGGSRDGDGALGGGATDGVGQEGFAREYRCKQEACRWCMEWGAHEGTGTNLCPGGDKRGLGNRNGTSANSRLVWSVNVQG
ncbi:hypothetical protein E2542_SST04961 [Spatholobus suberectus]|nr:hypothetical protein E2542_SST04961 [Spatholobus suberectus]